MMIETKGCKFGDIIVITSDEKDYFCKGQAVMVLGHAPDSLVVTCAHFPAMHFPLDSFPTAELIYRHNEQESTQ